MKGLKACSFENYLGLNLKKGRHSSLGHSAISSARDVDRQMRKERKEVKKLLLRIKKTCNIKYLLSRS
jgi:hypothetical protein